MSYYWSSGILAAFAVACCVAVFFPAKRASGGKSSSLSLLRAMIAFTMLNVLMDTANDAYITYLQTQTVPKRPGVTESVIRKVVLGETPRVRKETEPHKPGVSGGTGGTAAPRKRGGNSPAQINRGGTGRTVSDRKYELLGYICTLLFFLYLLGKPDTWDFVIRFIEALFLSWRGVARKTEHKEEISVKEDSPGFTPPASDAH